MKRPYPLLWLSVGFFAERAVAIHFFPALLFISLSSLSRIQAVWIAFMFGMAYDMISLLPFGFYTISCVVAVVVEGEVRARLFEHQRRSRAIAATMGVVGYTFARALGLVVIHRALVPHQLLGEMILQGVIVWCVIGIIENVGYKHR